MKVATIYTTDNDVFIVNNYKSYDEPKRGFLEFYNTSSSIAFVCKKEQFDYMEVVDAPDGKAITKEYAKKMIDKAIAENNDYIMQSLRLRYPYNPTYPGTTGFKPEWIYRPGEVTCKCGKE